MRATLAQHAGTVPDVAGRQVTCLPPPACLTDPGPVPGLGPVRRTRLVAVARAALDGKPDTAEPAALPPEQARQRLEQLPGIGPFSSAIVVVRALRHTDYLVGLGTELNTIVGGHAASGAGMPSSGASPTPWSCSRLECICLGA